MAKLWDDAEVYNYTPQNLTNRQAGLQAAQNKKQGGILDSLSSVLSGIAKSAKNTATGIAGTLGGVATNNALTNYIDARKIKASGEASDMEAAKALANARGKKREEEFLKQTYGGNGGKDTWNRVLGTNLDAASTLADFIPGVGKVGKAAINVAQGAASGFGQELAENGANADINRAKQSALIGGASGLAGDLTSNVLGKVGTNNIIGKAANSNLGRGIITGATAGATGGGLAAGLNGGSLADVLSNAAQGAKGGAIGGGTMAGIMGIGGALASRGKKNTTNTPVVEPEEATLVTKQRIAPTAESVSQMPEAKTTRKGIAVTDYYAGPEEVQVNRVRNAQKPQGKYIDGVVKGQNLPEAETPSAATRFAKAMEIPDEGHTTLASFVDSKGFGEDRDILNQLKGYISSDDYKALKAAAYDGDSANSAALDYELGGVANKTSLPPLNRAEAYDLFGKEVAQELPKYMLSKDGISFYDPALSDMFPQFKRATGEGSTSITADDVLDLYKKAAETDRSRIYTTDNIATGLALNPELSERIMGQLMDINSPARKVAVQGGPAVAERIVVETPVDLDTQYVKRTLPAKQYAQPIAETTAQTVVKNTTAEAPTARQAKKVTINPADEARLERQETVARQKQGDALVSMYGVLDKPTRRAVGDAGEVLNKLYDMGLETPADVQYAANHVTGADGDISKWTRELATSAKNVETQLDQAWINKLIEQSGLTDADAKSVQNQIVGVMKRTGANGYSDGNTTLDAIKNLEAHIRDIKGTNGRSYHNMTDVQKYKVNVLQAVRDELTDRLWASADDIATVVTPERIQALKNRYPDNAKWADYVDSNIAAAQDGRQLRASVKPLVDGSKIIQGSKMSAGSFADTLAGAAKSGNAKGAARSLAGAVVDKIANSDSAKLNRAKKYATEAANARAQLNGEIPVQNAKTGFAGKAKTAAQNIANSKLAQGAKAALGGASNILNNETLNNATIAGQTDTYGNMAAKQIARQAGLSQAEYANNRRELANATEAYDQAATDYMLGQQQVAQARAQAQASQQNDTLGRIANAMDMALAAGDTDAYNKLADLYTQAYKIDQMRNPQAYTTSNLTASQQAEVNKLDNAEKAINELEQLYATAGGGKGLIGGNAANLAASLGLNSDVKTYNDLSQGLINQIMAATGKTDTLNTEGEVKRALSLIPQFTDTQETAQKKLEALRTMLQGTRETLATNYGLTQ